MDMGLKIAMGSVAASAIGAASAVAIGRVAFDRRVSGEVDRLFAARATTEPTVVTDADLATLPTPVQRWLRFAGVVGKPRPVAVRLKQEGELRLGDRGWFPFIAEEYYTTDPPGFLWTARIKLAPLVSVVGRDTYAGGKGSMDMRLLGVLSVAKDSGPDMDRGGSLALPQ